MPTPQPQPVPAGKALEASASVAATGAGIGSGLVAKIAAVGNALGSGALSRAAEQGAEKPWQKLPQNCVINVVCMPAHDEADEIVALMLAQLLHRDGFCAFAVSVNALASEMVDQVETRGAHIVCISAIPPAAVTHSRYLCKRVHARYPDMDVVVGLWAYRGDFEKARARITCERDVSVQSTLASALHELHQRAQPIILRGEVGIPASAPSAAG